MGVDDFGDVNQKFGAALMTTGLAKCRGSISDVTLNFEPGHTTPTLLLWLRSINDQSTVDTHEGWFYFLFATLRRHHLGMLQLQAPAMRAPSIHDSLTTIQP